MPTRQNDLTQVLTQRIEANGPISVAEYMAEALGHPEFGYYMGEDPFGVDGDFTTAPEISQMFGELIGLWCANSWLALGKPTPFTLAELGPGRGTLMADALRALKTVPDCHSAARVHFVELSPHMRRRQLNTFLDDDIEISWRESVDELPMMPTIFIANEFFDALPIEQFVCQSDGWHLRLVGRAEQESRSTGEFTFECEREACPTERLPPAAKNPAEIGAIAESSPAAQEIAAEIARRIRSHTGAALIVDYGYAGPVLGDTLQAVYRHNPVPVLERPGERDLTAHVDFSALAEAARSAGAATWGVIPQGAFLRRLGIEARATMLLDNARPEQKTDIRTALERLIADDQMGTLFKVLAICQQGAAPPAGFVAEEASLS